MLAIFCCCLTLVLLYFGSQKDVKDKLKKQSEIFKDQHTWWQTYLYIMTFGSFIGYSSAFPKLIKDVFGYLPDGSVNPAMEGAVARYAWMGACIGSLARPIGGWLSDKSWKGCFAWTPGIRRLDTLPCALRCLPKTIHAVRKGVAKSVVV